MSRNAYLIALEERIEELEARVAQLESGDPAPDKAAPPEENSERPYEVVDVDGKVSGIADDQCRLSWRIVLRNLGDDPLQLKARIQFLDMDSFALEECESDPLRLAADGETQKFSGFALVSPETADNLFGVKAHIREI